MIMLSSCQFLLIFMQTIRHTSLAWYGGRALTALWDDALVLCNVNKDKPIAGILDIFSIGVDQQLEWISVSASRFRHLSHQSRSKINKQNNRHCSRTVPLRNTEMFSTCMNLIGMHLLFPKEIYLVFGKIRQQITLSATLANYSHSNIINNSSIEY